MYLEHEELLKMSNTLEQERDQARGEAYLMAIRLIQARRLDIMGYAEGDLFAHVVANDPTIQYCNDIIERYTPQ